MSRGVFAGRKAPNKMGYSELAKAASPVVGTLDSAVERSAPTQ